MEQQNNYWIYKRILLLVLIFFSSSYNFGQDVNNSFINNRVSYFIKSDLFQDLSYDNVIIAGGKRGFYNLIMLYNGEELVCTIYLDRNLEVYSQKKYDKLSLKSHKVRRRKVKAIMIE
jgi:hypothetical protein